MSRGSKKLVTILALVIFFPLGIGLMYFWKLWTVWIRILISGLIIIVALVSSYIVLNALTALNRLNDSLPSRTSVNQSQTAKSNFNIPAKNLYAADEIVNANGYEIKVNGFTKEKYVEKLTKREANYCAVSINIKNILDEPVAVSPQTNFILTPESFELEFPLSSTASLENFATKPNFEYIGEANFDLNPGEVKEFFIPFECREFKTNYTFQLDINQFANFVTKGEQEFKPVKFQLVLQ